MIGIWHVVVSVGIGIAWIFRFRGQGGAPETTLKTANNWGLLAGTLWTAVWFSDQCASLLSPAIADLAWYGCAVASLCPLIAVLGARRPGVRVWNWFILMPMVLALSWPVLALVFKGSELRGLELETPQFVAFTLVLVMGSGNYVGTRFTWPALLFAAAILAIVLSSTAISPVWLSNRSNTRFWSTMLLIAAMGLAEVTKRPPAKTSLDQLWLDFFDTFGIVWARRIQDRVNHLAQQEDWLVRLGLNGFVWPDESSSSDHPAQKPECDQIHDDTNRVDHRILDSKATSATHDLLPGQADQDSSKLTTEAKTRIEHTFRWLLRRFVDPVWIDRRLGKNPKADVKKLSVDT